MDRLHTRAAELGIETEYRDASGKMRSVDAETLARLVDALSADGDTATRVISRTIVFRCHRDARLRVEAPPGSPVRWDILGDEPIASGAGAAPFLTLPDDLPIGVFRLGLTVVLPQGERHEEATLLVAPERAYQGRDNTTRRVWGLAVQLYGVRSQRNWGHGDFTDLAALIDLAAACGAAAIGLNPLHVLFDDKPEEISPYSPNSRLFLNPLYIDVEAIPEFPGLAAARLEQEVVRLRETELVQYPGVASAKMRALRLAFESFRTGGASERRGAFENYCKEHAPVLRRYACFEVLRRRFKTPWWEWPVEWQNADDDVLRQLETADSDAIAFHQFVQWIAHEQLAACSERARRRGLPIGLYLDIAVGVRPEGFDAWHDRDSALHDVHVGAPPDILNTQGQNWGLAGLNPVGLERNRFESSRRMLRSAMRYAGAIRLDHVLGLKRLFLIPKGLRAEQGGYVRFPFEALLAVAAQESVWNGCIVIGEDLGTVPENFRETLADWGIWSYQVMMFERDHAGNFIPPEQYRENALVTFNTHDLPTFAGWTAHHDLAVKRQLGLDPGESDTEREKARAALAAALGRNLSPEFPAVADYLARTPARLVVVSMEDVLGIADQPNIPGTIDQHPNWRRRLPVSVEDLQGGNALAAVAKVMASAARAPS